MTTWRELLANELGRQADTTAIIAIAPDATILDVEFDHGPGGVEGPPFLVWTFNRVYFPIDYDGCEWVGSAPRHPARDGQEHVGHGGTGKQMPD